MHHPARAAIAAVALLTLASCGGGSGGDTVTDPSDPTRASLTKVTTVAPGRACAYGGKRVDVGPDIDGNGTLDEREIETTFHGCNGAPGADGDDGAAGISSLVSVRREPAGANCAAGGSRASFGLDANRDGMLQAAEVTNTAYSCHGTRGPAGPQGPNGRDSLTVLSNEPPGANCPAGGTRMRSGLDLDRDGVLDAAEVTTTDFACNGTNGNDGADGFDSLSLITPEPAGVRCAAAGSRIDSGVDRNRNGVLDAAEVTNTAYACNGSTGAPGADGADGLTTLVRTVAEPAGANCANGGTRITGGLDLDRDNVLDAGEVTSTVYACHGADGPQGPAGDDGLATLFNAEPEAAGANCAAGGRKLTSGLDSDRDGVLDASEVLLTSYVCNGEQGPQGPQGPSGATAVYGDGSGGSLTINATTDLTTLSGFNSLGGRHHLQFTNITINGTLVVPSGLVLRATGDVTVSTIGTIVVAPGTRQSGTGTAHPGASAGAAMNYYGGTGLYPLTAAGLRQPPAAAGGAGFRPTEGSGGNGGGSLVILAQGTVRVMAGAAINAIGDAGTGPFTATTDIGGAGGGAGGIVVIASKTGINVNAGGAIRASGGRGANGIDGNAGTQGAGGGGGGGGGIIHLISPTTPVVTGTLDVSGGAAGTDAAAGTLFNQPGGGGGALGGSGGNGGWGNPGASTPFVPAGAGSSGYTFTTIVPSPENLFLP